MIITAEDRRYFHCMEKLRSLIPPEEYNAVLSQDECELDIQFLGFLNIYYGLSQAVPKDKIILDFGCYLAAQSYFFARHKQYIGIDTVTLRRFTPSNAIHYVSTIQGFLKDEAPRLFQQHNPLELFAICSYVPDSPATALVRNAFPNVFCYYPSSNH